MTGELYSKDNFLTVIIHGYARNILTEALPINITRIYPRKVSGIITLVTEDIDDNGIVSVKTLFPSDKQSNENSRVLIYSNVGMLWYDASFYRQICRLRRKNLTATADLCLTVICSKMILFQKMLIISKIALILRTKIFQMFPTRLNP